MQQQQQLVQNSAGHYVVKADNGFKFLIRLLALILSVTFFIGAFGVFIWRVDLVAYFTPFKIIERDALYLFVIFLFLSVAFMAIARQWKNVIWWMFLGLLIFAAYMTYGKAWGDSTAGPGIVNSIVEKFSFKNIKSLSGTTIPTEGSGVDPFTTKNTVSNPAFSGPPTKPQADARAKAVAEHKRVVNIWVTRLKKAGYTYDSVHSSASSKWCDTPAQRANWDKKHPKLNWLDDAKCVLGQNWSIK